MPRALAWRAWRVCHDSALPRGPPPTAASAIISGCFCLLVSALALRLLQACSLPLMGRFDGGEKALQSLFHVLHLPWACEDTQLFACCSLQCLSSLTAYDCSSASTSMALTCSQDDVTGLCAVIMSGCGLRQCWAAFCTSEGSGCVLSSAFLRVYYYGLYLIPWTTSLACVLVIMSGRGPRQCWAVSALPRAVAVCPRRRHLRMSTRLGHVCL